MNKTIRQRIMAGLILTLLLYLLSVAGTVFADCPSGECRIEQADIKPQHLIFYWPCMLCKNADIEPIALPREKPSTATIGAPIWTAPIGFLMR